jgi:hypothetical protein
MPAAPAGQAAGQPVGQAQGGMVADEEAEVELQTAHVDGGESPAGQGPTGEGGEASGGEWQATALEYGTAPTALFGVLVALISGGFVVAMRRPPPATPTLARLQRPEGGVAARAAGRRVPTHRRMGGAR